MANTHNKGNKDQGNKDQGNKDLTQQTKDVAAAVASQTGDIAGSAGDQARSAAGSLADKARDMAGNVADQARNLTANMPSAQDLTGTVRDTVSNLGQRAGDAVSGLPDQMRHLAGSVRERVPQEGMMGTAASGLATGLESGASYLQDHNMRDMADDLAGIVRSHPIPSVLIGLGLGFLIGRAMSTRS